jgi:hypothetical protein
MVRSVVLPEPRGPIRIVLSGCVTRRKGFTGGMKDSAISSRVRVLALYSPPKIATDGTECSGLTISPGA